MYVGAAANAFGDTLPSAGNGNPMDPHSSHSPAMLIPTAKLPKRRARMACSFCQSRKIRCNVEDHSPCSQCILEQVDCCVTKTRRSKRPKLIPVAAAAPDEAQRSVNVPVPVPVAIPVVASTTLDDGVGVGVDALSHHQNTTPNRRDSHASRSPLNVLQPQRPLDQSYHPDDNNLPANPPTAWTPSAGSSHSQQRNAKDGILEPVSSHLALPAFLKSVPKHLKPEDIDYLQRKGCFEIPAPKFRDALLRSYADYFHPAMPVLDLTDFVQNIWNPSGQGGRISLFLFQAVMFAGSSHCDIRPLRALGFLNRKAARRALYLKTKALYEMEYEQNRLCVIQALAIMTYWYDTPDDQKDSTHWLVIALSLARREGLDQDMANMNISAYERRMARRIWWSCVSRDAQCALGLKGPLALEYLDPGIPPLSMDDFDQAEEYGESHEHLGKWTPFKQRLCRLACVAQCTLQIHLRSIYSEQYRLGSHSRRSLNTGGKTSKMVLLPVINQTTRDRLEDLDRRLREWKSALPPELQDTEVTPELSDPSLESFIVFRSFLHMLYHTLLITLYRPWVQTTARNHQFVVADAALQDRAQSIVRESAHSISDIAIELHQLDLAKFLPQIGLATLLPAAISHACDMLTSSEGLRRAGLVAFERCTHVINELRDNFYSADFSADFCKILARAKRLSDAAVPEMASREWIGDGFDEQISRFSGASCVPLPSRGTTPGLEQQQQQQQQQQGWSHGPPPPLAAHRPIMPEAGDADFATAHDAGGGIWNRDAAVTAYPQDSTAFDLQGYHDYDANIREETARLLGHLYDDFQPGLFDTLGLDGILS